MCVSRISRATSFKSNATKQMSVFPFRALATHRSRSDWFEFDEKYQVMLPGPGGQTTRTCAKDSSVAKLRENRGVHWLPGSATESTDGATLCIKSRVARLVVEATTNSETKLRCKRNAVGGERKHSDSNTRHYHAT